MSVSQKLVGPGLGIVLTVLSAGSAWAQKDSDVVAEVGNVKLTVSDLEKRETNKLLQARYQYYQAESKALEDLIEQELLAQKARSEGLTVERLIDRDIKSQVKDPTEDQLKVYYEGLETDQPYEAVRGKVLEKIRQIRTDKVRSAYLKSLGTAINVVVELRPPNAEVNLGNANWHGSKNAPVVLVEFADYECPYCQRVAPDIKRLQDEFGEKLAVAYKDFPLPMHAHAQKAAEAARCAGKQGKFWEYHDQLFRSKELSVDQLKGQALVLKLDATQFDKCLDSGEEAAAVQENRGEGSRLGLTGTPSFFVNGYFFSGALDYNALHRIIEQQLVKLPRAENKEPLTTGAIPESCEVSRKTGRD